MRRLLLTLALLSPVVLTAQPAPTVVSTLRTTDTSATSIKVGCTLAGTCTGGISAGPIAGTTGAFSGALTGLTLAIGGGTVISSSSNIPLLNAENTFTLSTNGVFAQSITNTNAGSSALARLNLGNNTDAAIGRLIAYSSTTATSGMAGANITALTANGGLNLGTTGSASLGLYTNNLLRWGINAAGDFTAGASSNIAIGSGAPSLNTFSGGSSPTVPASQRSYAFSWTSGTGNTSVTIDLGRTYASAAVCVAVAADSSDLTYSTSTTQIVFTVVSNTTVVYVHCLGY